MASNLGITIPAEAKPSPLQTEQVRHIATLPGSSFFQEVNWCMEVICHGLCLPLEDHMVIRYPLKFKKKLNVRFPPPEIVSTYIVSGCQHFCLTQNSVCQGKEKKEFWTDQLTTILTDRSWSSQTYMQERSSRISTIFLSQGREKVSRLISLFAL